MSKNVIYQPDGVVRKSYGQIVLEIVAEIRANRWLTFQLFKRDFTAAYKQSMMGVIWTFVIPLISISTFLILNRSGVFNIGSIDVPYALYAVLGMAVWQLFSAGLLSSSQSLVLAGQMISKISFSKKSLVLASVGQAIIAFIIQIVLFLALCLFYKFVPHVEILYLPLVLIPVLFLTLAAGLILSLVNCVVKDISNILPMLLTFFMFLTPVLYKNPSVGGVGLITTFNPMYHFITTLRDLAFLGHVGDWTGFWFASAFSAALFVVCLVFFHLTETKITERI